MFVPNLHNPSDLSYAKSKIESEVLRVCIFNGYPLLFLHIIVVLTELFHCYFINTDI